MQYRGRVQKGLRERWEKCCMEKERVERQKARLGGKPRSSRSLDVRGKKAQSRGKQPGMEMPI